MDIDPWTVYWQADHLESCIPSRTPEDSKEIAAFWQECAVTLKDGASVVDLACGNGAIPNQLLSVNSTLQICAVDKAEISPLEYLSHTGKLASVRFLPATDICELPFDDNSIDAVTSQFGIEYAPLKAACKAAVRVLKPGGVMRLLMHHAESEIVMPASATIAEITRLLEQQGPMKAIESFVSGKISIEQLETIGETYLQAEIPGSKQVSGQVFSGIDHIIDVMKTNPSQAQALLVNMGKRLVADRSRLQQLQSAALDEQQADSVAKEISELGMDIDIFEPFLINDQQEDCALIGWKISARKA